jgi:chaperonin GroES
MTDLAYADDLEDEALDHDEGEQIDRLQQFANTEGDISHLLTEDELSTLGSKVVEEWNKDKNENNDWREAVTEALKQAAQDKGDTKTFPWGGASNVQYPLLTVAAQQFAARAYPAIVKGDEAVGIKVVGKPPQEPAIPQNLPPPDQMPPQMQQALQAVMMGYQQAQEAWTAKNARAERVKTWMNYHLFYGMDDWEGDVDTLLNQLPIIGQAFKKVYFDPHRGVCSDYVNALHLTVAKETQSLERCPRVTQDFELYPYEIKARQASGFYRDVNVEVDQEDEQTSRTILEQHRLEDLDDDGIEEPYIITVDEKSAKVLRIEAPYTSDDIARSTKDDKLVHIRRWMPFIPFQFMPDPEGNFYGLGFGQLLKQLTAVINTAINQLNDAATAAAAGGGFIAQGVRLQGAGQTTTLRFAPGEYKSVTVNGQALRDGIFERTIPNPSPVTFQLLELMLGAAKEVASIKDVLTGDTPATAPVGTTLALIEQGLQSFSAIFKRVYRAEKAEFKAIYECMGRWGDPEAYKAVLDDPSADMASDFSIRGEDIVPVSDPSVVTRSQALAKAQVIQQTESVFPDVMNKAEAVKRILEAAQIDEDGLIPPPPKGPPPQLVAELQKTASETEKNLAQARNYDADARVKTGEAEQRGAENAAFALGAAHEGRVPSVEGQPGQPMGLPGAGGGGEEAGGGLDLGKLAVGEGGPLGAEGAADAG